MADRGYFHLLSHLHRSTTTVSLSAIQGSIVHYLAHLQPSPTPLAAAVVSSPLFRPITYERVAILKTAFRHAVHVKVKSLRGEQRSVFVRSVSARTADWVRAVLKGFHGGHSMIRLACSGGLLQGLSDLEGELRNKDSRIRREVEEEAIVALAEAIDMYSPASLSIDWQKDFQHESYESKDLLALTFTISADVMILVASHRLKALPLHIGCGILVSTISDAFLGGNFISLASTSVVSTETGITIPPSSPLAQTINAMNSSFVMSSIASLSKFCGQALTVLVESRPSYGWIAITRMMRKLERLTRKVEDQWLRSPLASISEESSIAPESRETMTMLWNILKTILFTTIMLLQSVLPALLFIPYPASIDSDAVASPFDLSLIALHTFSHLSFILSQFGGVTSTSEDGLPELKKAFYMALDVLSESPSRSDLFVHQLCDSFKDESLVNAPEAFMHAKKAYALACVEQLVPVLSEDKLREDVLPLCIPHLSDPSHREVYESAHSVILAIFASHAHKASEYAHGEQSTTSFTQQIIPNYVKSLIDNAPEGRLTTTQLCLAYAAVVRSASSSRRGAVGEFTDGDALAWLCVEQFLDTIRQLSPTPPISTESHLHRLHMALVATVPSVSLVLLPRILAEIKTIIQSHAEESSKICRTELVHYLFKNISENVGDAEKEYAMRWWEENKDGLGRYGETRSKHGEHGPEPSVLSARL